MFGDEFITGIWFDHDRDEEDIYSPVIWIVVIGFEMNFAGLQIMEYFQFTL